MTSVEEENKKIDIEEIDLENLDEKNNSNQQNNSEDMNKIESKSKKEKSLDKNEIWDLKDNTKSKENNENKEILSNEGTDEKNNENKEEKGKDENEKDNKSENKEIKNKSEINGSQINSGNLSEDNNNKKLKDGDNGDIENKNKNENKLKDVLSPSYSKISYRPSEYKSILKNIELTESDKLLIEKYSNHKSNSYKMNNNDLCNNLSFIKRLTYNYQTSEEPRIVNYLSKNKYNTIEAIQNQNLNNNYISNLKNLLKNENEKTKIYLKRNNLKINDIGKDINFSWDNIFYKPDNKIEKYNSEKILFTNSQIGKDITYSYKSDENDSNQGHINNLKGDYSSKSNLKKEDGDFNLNFNYSYNISRKQDKNRNLLNNTSLSYYHIPHTQSSIMANYMPNYSIFDLNRYINYKSNSSSIPNKNINKYNNVFYSYDIQSINNNYNQNMNKNDIQYNNNNYNANTNYNNYKRKLHFNYENTNLNSTNANSIINNKDKNMDINNNINNKENQNNINIRNQSVKDNEKPFIKKVTNPKRFPSNSLSIPKYNSKKYKSLLFDDDKKGSFILDNKNSEKYANNKLFQPYYPFQKNLNKNQNYDFTIKNKKGGDFRDDRKEIKKNSSPFDAYYNSLFKEHIPKTQNIGRNNKLQFSRTYQINDNRDMNNRKYLFYFSTIRNDLIDKNKKKSFKEL